jgi:hypothetical protein
MNEILSHAFQLLRGGFGNLAAYLAAHVLLCLVPAFFIAGGLAALIPKAAVARLLGRGTPKYISYPAATLAGSVLAVCSCTIVPLFAGIYKKGAGLGPAITFLFFAPAANILALVYTGGVIGADLAFARFALSLVFGISIGMIMALIFSRQDIAHNAETDDLFAARERIRKPALVFLLVLVVLLLLGTLKLNFLTGTYGQVTLPLPGLDRFQEWLHQLVPFDSARGEEGISVQGAILIGLLVLIAFSAWRGLNNVTNGINRWTRVTLGLLTLTLFVAAVGMNPRTGGLDIEFTGRSIAILLSVLALTYMGRRWLAAQEIRDWLWESWRFVKQIFPLLVIGVFSVGIIRQLLRPEWVESLAGSNTLAGNLAGVVFGVFMYFPTLVEVPIAQMFLSLGMHRGPLLAYLMADPELSLQSILIVSAIIGRLRAWTYVAWVALFSTLAGLIYGSWIDGAAVWVIGLYLAGIVALLSCGLYMVNQRNLRRAALVTSTTRDER